MLCYRALASSSANALCGETCRGFRCFLPPRLGLSMLGPAMLGPATAAGLAPFGRGGRAGFARRMRSSSGARSKRRMIESISSRFGASMKAKPLDSWVSGLRITLTSSATRFSARNHERMSSFVTQAGRFPRNTVKLIQRRSSLRRGLFGGRPRDGSIEAPSSYHSYRGTARG